jgi:type I restriction enzyme S subunit
MSEEATLDEFAQQEECGEQKQKWRNAKLHEVAYKRSDNVDPQQVELERHVGLEHINSNDPAPDWEPLDNLSSTKRRFEAGDILFAKLRPNLEKSAQPDFDGVASTDIFPIVAESDVNSKWLLYRLSSKSAYDYARRTSAGTRMPRTSWNLFGNFSFDLPPLPEQRKIATVLYTVDRAIEKTEEIVEQVERTKQALTQSLFLNGYFDHRETVEAYHQNRLPRHPAEWQTKPAGEVMEVTRGAHPRPKSDDTLWRGEIPIVKIGDRNRGDSRTITSTDDTVTEKGSKKSKLVDQGTLIVSNAGTVGTARITGMQTCIHDHWLILRDYEENLSTRYLYYFINWNQEFLEALASGSTVLDLNTDDFRLFDITFPSLEEQQKIADTLDSLHNRKMVNVEYSDRLNRIKRGLMQDLVSGTVRTTDTNIEVPDEIAQYG